MGRDGGAALSLGPDGARGRGARRRPAPVDREPRLHRPESAPGARRRPRASRRAASRSRPRPRRGLGRRAARDAAGARRARRARAARLAQDLGLARHARQRAHPSALELRPGPARGPGAGARGRAPRARPREQQVVEGGAARRLPRLQPERQGPDGGVGLVRAAHARRARLDAARVGRGGRLRSRCVHAGHRDGSARGPGRRRRRHRRGSASQEAAGLGDAPWPPHYRKQHDEPPRVAPSRRKVANAGTERGSRRQAARALVTVAKAARKEEALAGLERWKARHPAAAARLQMDDVLVDSMRGRSTTWTRVRINLRHVPEGERPPAEPPEPDYDPWLASGRSRPGPRAPKTRSSS
jgi:hypothetical protein